MKGLNSAKWHPKKRCFRVLSDYGKEENYIWATLLTGRFQPYPAPIYICPLQGAISRTACLSTGGVESDRIHPQHMGIFCNSVCFTCFLFFSFPQFFHRPNRGSLKTQQMAKNVVRVREHEISISPISNLIAHSSSLSLSLENDA